MAFALALLGLAIQLRRPATRALALAWLWTTAGLVSVAAYSFVDPDGHNPWYTLAFLGLTLASMGASMPAFDAASAALDPRGNSDSLRAVHVTCLTWAGALFAIGAVLVALGAGPLKHIDRFTGIVGRVVIFVLYIRCALITLSRRHVGGGRFRFVLVLLSLSLVVQAVRPVLVLLFFGGPPTGTMTDAWAITFVGLHVFAATVFGVACLLLALAEERAVIVAAGAQLQEAALRLERSHRLESIGRLANGVAHDFNNLLTVITNSAELARQAQHNGDAVDDELREIESAAARGASLTKQLLAYARRQPQQVTCFDAGEKVQQMSSMLNRLVGGNVALEVAVQPQPTVVSMDPVPFEQVVLNLVANARDAMPQGGHIDVGVRTTVIEDARRLPDGELPPGPYVALTVSDNGRGINEATMERLFEPFFTTRQDEGGTGLGLATVQGIVRQAGGDVSVESAVGAGATFTVLLPSHARLAS